MTKNVLGLAGMVLVVALAAAAAAIGWGFGTNARNPLG